MSRALKRAAAWILLQTGAVRFRANMGQRGSGLLLTYHRVNDDRDPFYPALPSSAFEQQIDFLQDYYLITPLEEVLDWLDSGAPGRPRAVITIDDGYPDTHDVVLPILRERALPATLFLSTGPVETGKPLWLDRLRALLKLTRKKTIDCPKLGIQRWPAESLADKLVALERLRKSLKLAGPQAVEDTLGELSQCLGVSPSNGMATLTWSQLKAMQRSNFGFGAHTHRHYILSRLDRSEAQEEIDTSVQLIRERLGIQVDSFAYPNGMPADYSPSVKSLLAESGIRRAFTMQSGLALPTSDPLETPRMYASRCSLPVFACRVTGFSRTTVEEGIS